VIFANYGVSLSNCSCHASRSSLSSSTTVDIGLDSIRASGNPEVVMIIVIDSVYFTFIVMLIFLEFLLCS
jgi:hypothetical protein